VNVIHLYVGFLVPAGWTVIALWALVAFLRNKAAGERYWALVAVMQVVLGVQIVLGTVLLVVAFASGSGRPPWLHYAYGALFPIALLVFAHRWGRDHKEISFVGFGIAAFLIAGLTVRALMTGLGIG
jgi:hypothetical protein